MDERPKLPINRIAPTMEELLAIKVGDFLYIQIDDEIIKDVRIGQVTDVEVKLPDDWTFEDLLWGSRPTC